MSLYCAEHWDGPKDHPFVRADEVFAAQLVGGEEYVAICREVLDAIPEQVRHSETIPDGVDIFRAYSKPNALMFFEENLSWSDFKLDTRLFSLSSADAAQYLPNSNRNLRSTP